MAANTKYQPASQRDSFEESNYTQAPPSYQAEAQGNDGLLGAPRGEDDNVPDDFKVWTRFTPGLCHSPELQLIVVQFGGSVAEATIPIRMQFIRKVYSIL